MSTVGRASLSRNALLESDQVLTSQRFRRANGIARAETAMIDTLVNRDDRSTVRSILIRVRPSRCPLLCLAVKGQLSRRAG
jgi:hypothetical protein